MSKKEPAWRAVERADIAAASYFTVVKLLGGGQRHREEYTTLESALCARERMGADEHGRRPGIYAVTPNGKTIFVEI